MQIGLVGCGSIGAVIAKHIYTSLKKEASLHMLCDCDPQRLHDMNKQYPQVLTSTSWHEVVSSVDVVIESCSALLSGDIARTALQAGKIVMILSVGGLLDVYEDLVTLSQRFSGQLLLPSGAIVGLDGLHAASVCGIESVELVTKKHPRGLEGAPFLVNQGISLDPIGDEPTLIFDGSAKQAIAGFPKNINVAVLLSLAGLGGEHTRVKIFSSRLFQTNTHQITVKGPFGTFQTTTMNVPSPDNPKTSYLASLSACAMLTRLFSPIKVGT